MNNEWIKALRKFSEAADIFQELNNCDGLTRSYLNIGKLLTFNKSFEKAERYFMLAAQYSKATKDNALMSTVLNNTGINFLSNRNTMKHLTITMKH